MVFLNDGRFVSAENLFLEYEHKGKIVKDDNEKIIDVRTLNIKIPSFNKNECKIEESNLSFIWKIKTHENLIELEFGDGKKIKTTSEHKFLAINEDYEIVEKRSYELEGGDFVISPRRLSFNPISLEDLELIFVKELSKNENFLVYLNENFKEELHRKIIDYGKNIIWEEIKSDLKFLSFYHGIWKGRYKLCDLVKIFEIFKIPLYKLYKNISYLGYRESLRKEFKSSVKIKLPKNEKDWKDFFYLMGLLFGDGDVNVFLYNNDKQIQDESKRICKDVFGVNSTLRLSEKCPRIDLRLGLAFTKILTNLFDYPLRSKSGNIKFPSLIQKLPNYLISKFISGYFDADGSVTIRHPVMSCTKSEQFVRGLQFVLMRFGVLSTIYQKDAYLNGKVFPLWNLIVNGFISNNNFKENVGFNLQYKKEKLGIFLSKSKLGKKFDYLPYNERPEFSKDGKYYTTLDNNNLLVQQFLHQEVYFNQLKNKKEIENLDGYVFDFSIYGNENFIADGLIVHNTTFSDNLLFGAGMMSEELSGKQLALDFHEDEQERGITIDSANVSMVHTVDEVEHLINLIDTPGHVDFGGDVTRAMRAVDGAIVLVDAVEGIMPQTETVLRQALRERVRPILFINKVDRLIREVKLTPDKMQERFVKIINDVNRFIVSISPEEFKDKWQVAVQDGQVGFGSAFHNWALSIPYMKRTGITFKDVIEAYEKDNYKELAKKAPLHSVVLNMVVKHHPNPIDAQKYRIPKIWHGDLESEEGKSLINCDPKGPVGFIITKIVVDRHAGEVAAGRLFSGTLRQGDELYANALKRKFRVQQVNIYKGASRFQVDEAPAGNIIGLIGLKDAFAGETVSTVQMEPFEAIKHLFEPVVTKSIEATKAADLPKLVEVLKQVNKEDPSIKIEINEETGENLMSGMGELHLEVIENRIVKEKGLQVKTSDPIVVYRETVLKKSIEFEGKSPNKHNKFYIQVEPLEGEVYSLIKSGDIPEVRIKKKDDSVTENFIKSGYDTKDAKRVREIFNSCVLYDNTRGIVHIGEVIEMIMDGFEQVMREGPLSREPCMKIKVIINDMKLHEDAIHRGPAQVLPAIRDAIKDAMRNAGVNMFEPLQVLQIDSPVEYMGAISKLVQNKRGALLNMEQEGEHITITSKLPVAEMFGLTSELRSATGGRGNFYVIDQVFEKVPEQMQGELVKKIRQRKGLAENQ